MTPTSPASENTQRLRARGETLALGEIPGYRITSLAPEAGASSSPAAGQSGAAQAPSTTASGFTQTPPSSGSMHLDPHNDPPVFGQRLLSGRARAGTLPSSLTRFAITQSAEGKGDERASIGVARHADASASSRAVGRINNEPSWTDAVGANNVLLGGGGDVPPGFFQSHQGPDSHCNSSARPRSANLHMPRFPETGPGSAPGTPSDLSDGQHSASSTFAPSFAGVGARPGGSKKPPSSSLRQLSSTSLRDVGRTSPAIGPPSAGTSSYSSGIPGPFDSTGRGTSMTQDNSQDITSRSRSGSSASLRATSAIRPSAFGLSIFTSPWTDRNSGPGDQESLSSRRSSTLASSTRPESGSSFVFDYHAQNGKDQFGDHTPNEQHLSGNHSVSTLDYLGLEHDDGASLQAGRQAANPASSVQRNRASTLASVPPESRQRTQLQSLYRNISRPDAGSTNIPSTGDAWQDGIFSAFSPNGGSRGVFEHSNGQLSATLGRNRAGTVAALGGPGGRQRLEQEMMRMATAGNLSGLSNAEVSSILNAHLEQLGLGGSHAPLEGFPHLDVATPPPLSTRQSPYPTQPPTPTINRARSKSSLDDAATVGAYTSAAHLARTQQGQSGGGSNSSGASSVMTDQHMLRDGSPLLVSSTPMNQTPSRSLWIGNLDVSTTGQQLMHFFAPYGAIESLRLLPDKECGFVNFVEMADAMKAREDVLGRLGGRLDNLGSGPGGRIRIGFGKVELAGPAGPTGHSALPLGGISTDARSASGAILPGNRPANRAQTTDIANLDDAGESAAPTRALWVGSIPSTATTNTLLSIFQPFGPIESARVLSHKNCGFINFERVDDAVRARKILNGRDVLGSEVGAMRIGFAKVPARNIEAFPAPDADPWRAMEGLAKLKGAQSVSLPVNEQISSAGLENYRSNLVVSLLNEQQKQGAALQGLGQGSAQAKPARQSQQLGATPEAVAASAAAAASTTVPSRGTTINSSSSIVPASDKGGVPLPPHMAPQASVSDLQLLMRDLSAESADTERDVTVVGEYRPSGTYYITLPLVTEVSSGRRFETSRLREARRGIEAGNLDAAQCDKLALEYLDSIVDLASDYIGNTLVQKFFEVCTEDFKLEMLHRLAPHLAIVGCHKNGTWAAQKILDCATNLEQVSLIAQNLRPYVPGLLLNEFGNYVVQCCLPWRQHNDFVFDAMVDRCWEIAQGRYGARSMRACLESVHTTTLQRKRVTIAIILNSVPLATSSNGALLLAWLLETSGLPRSFRLLAPRLAPHLAHLCTHKIASPTILRLVTQTAEPEASQTILRALFEPAGAADPVITPGASASDVDSSMSASRAQPSVLEEIVIDQVHGSQFITKALAAPSLQPAQRERFAKQVRMLLEKHMLVGVPAYRRLCEDLGLLLPPPASQYGVPPASAGHLPPHPQGGARSHQPHLGAGGVYGAGLSSGRSLDTMQRGVSPTLPSATHYAGAHPVPPAPTRGAPSSHLTHHGAGRPSAPHGSTHPRGPQGMHMPAAATTQPYWNPASGSPLPHY